MTWSLVSWQKPRRIIDEVFNRLDEWLTDVNQRKVASEIHTLAEAIAAQPASNLVVISVPGEFAAHETAKASKPVSMSSCSAIMSPWRMKFLSSNMPSNVDCW